MAQRYTFVYGQQYTRRQVFRVVGVPEDTWGGNWFTGYHQHEGVTFIFTNVGTQGRTGHDYHNTWEGSRLRWFGKTDTRLSQPTIQAMLAPEAEVHLFWRAENDRPFTYAGLASPEAVVDSSPVEVRWRFAPPIIGDGYDSADELRNGTFVEGSVKQVVVNAYERSPAARRACILHYGARCQVCGVSFKERYGAIVDGFIHVHHLVPLAAIGEEYALDAVRDLRPVCPNCHAVLHRTDPPLSIEELKAMIDDSGDAQ
jgi:5-methylcytosine-specific restriction protein A